MTEQLTPRQVEVARLVAAGKSAKRIADELGITIDTVNEHIQAAADRLPGDGSPKIKLVIFVIGWMHKQAAEREAS